MLRFTMICFYTPSTETGPRGSPHRDSGDSVQVITEWTPLMASDFRSIPVRSPGDDEPPCGEEHRINHIEVIAQLSKNMRRGILAGNTAEYARRGMRPHARVQTRVQCAPSSTTQRRLLMSMPMNSHYARSPAPATPAEAPTKALATSAAKTGRRKAAKSKVAKKK